MEQELIGKIQQALLPVVKEILKPVSKLFKQTIQNRILEYVIQKASDLSMTNTLLHKIPVPLDDIYYLLRIETRDGIIIPRSLNDYFQKSNKIIIIGDGGGGKTTLMNYTYINSYKSFGQIPILFNLRNINNYNYSEKKQKGSNLISKNIMFTALSDHLLFNKISVDADMVISMFDSGKFIFILEGFDELPNEYTIVSEIKEFISRFSTNKFLITTRNYTAATAFSNFTSGTLLGLDVGKDLEPFIRKQLMNNQGLADRIIEELNSTENKEYINLLTNPLFLILFINSFDSYPKLPQMKSAFFYQLFDALYAKHDSFNKDGYIRTKFCHLSRGGFESVLERFCFLSYFNNIYDFKPSYFDRILKTVKSATELEFEVSEYIQDLKISIPMLIETGGIYKFIHRTLQEYFAAAFIINQPHELQIDILNHILGEEDISSNMFLLELVAELDEDLYSGYFVINYMKMYFAKYCQVFEMQYPSNGLMNEALRNYLLVNKAIDFSPSFKTDLLEFIESKRPSFRFSPKDAFLSTPGLEGNKRIYEQLIIINRNKNSFFSICDGKLKKKFQRKKDFVLSGLENRMLQTETNQKKLF